MIKCGIAGLGRMGQIHALNIANRIGGCQISAVCTHQPAGLDFASHQLNKPKIYDDYAEMVKDDNVDAVIIVTASDRHCQQVIQALQAGKHVFTEKPLGTDLASCQQVADCVSQHPELIFMVGFMRRYDPTYAYAMEKIKAGAIGTPYLIKATALDPAAAAAEFIKYTKHSAGIFLDLGIHDLDLMRWYLNSEITEIYAQGATFKYPQFHQLGDDETAIASLKFASGALGQMHIGRTGQDGYHVETEIVGTEGTIRVSAVPAKNRAELLLDGRVETECLEGFPQRFEQAYLNEMTAFISCIASGRQPEVSVNDGLQAVRAALAAKKAWQTGQAVKL